MTVFQSEKEHYKDDFTNYFKFGVHSENFLSSFISNAILEPLEALEDFFNFPPPPEQIFFNKSDQDMVN